MSQSVDSFLNQFLEFSFCFREELFCPVGAVLIGATNLVERIGIAFFLDTMELL